MPLRHSGVSGAQGGSRDLRQLVVENTLLLVVWAIAATVTMSATVVALRAGRRARQAADLVSQLLEPDVFVADPSVETFPASVIPSVAVDPTPRVPPTNPPRELRTSDTGATADRDPGQARIPVFDLDRLRWWLTDGEVVLGRIAVVSVELDNLAHVNERLGYTAGAHLVEAITSRLRALTRPRDVVAHVNPERFVLVCRDVPDRDAAAALAERIAMGVAHPSVVVAGVAEVTASIGVALAFAAHERPENVLGRALKAGNRARARRRTHRDLGGFAVTDHQ